MSQSDVGMGYDCMDAGGRAMQERLPSDSVTQQIQEQSPKYRGGAEIPGYSTLTRPPGIVDGWENVPLSSVIRLIRGVTYSKNDSSDEQKNGFLPVLRANNIQKGRLIFEDLVYVPNSRISKQQKIKQGDIVIAMSSGSRSVVGKAARATNDWLGGFGAFCGVLRPSELIEERYVNWFTASSEYRNKVSELAAGVNINNLKPSHFDEIFIPFASLAEQQQIAAKLDELLAQVDNLKTRLDTIPKILKRFRQSVLADAVTGRLTEDWQAESKNWKVASLGSISEFQNGFAFKSEWFEESGDYQVIKLANIKDNYLKLDASPTYISLERSNGCLNYALNAGDLLISMTGTRFKRDYGFVCIVPEEIKILVNQRVGRIIPIKQMVKAKFLLIYLRLEEFRNQFFAGETGGVNQGNVGSGHIKSCEIKLPSIEEQTEIVRRVEQLFAYAGQIEQRVKDAQARVNHLSQSILAKAFRGELTAEWREQNPDLISGENSAEALLARIKSEREMAKPGKQPRRLIAK